MATVFQLTSTGLQQLIDTLHGYGYETIGPTVKDAAIVLDRLVSIEDLPFGWTDRQSAGEYELIKNGDQGFFQFSCGPHPWKRFLFPPEWVSWQADIRDGKIFTQKTDAPLPSFGFVGMRPCDLHALEILDTVLLQQVYADPIYAFLRKHLFIIVVNCFQPGGTCFCTAVGGSPIAVSGFDIVLNEVVEKDHSLLMAEPGSRKGAEVLEKTGCGPAPEQMVARLKILADEAASHMDGAPNLSDMGSLLQDRFDAPHWHSLDLRCLACGNCTMVCPTCFCYTLADTGSLDGSQAQRLRIQDSCFNLDFSYLHGGSVRASVRSRYRHWFLHKLVTWKDQFGVPGCVGCGRCITWCPAGIDLRREAECIAG